MSNVVCFKHRNYNGDGSPDLSCKTCCSMFVARIRKEQALLLDSRKEQLSTDFAPLTSALMTLPEGNNIPKFDSSWI